MNDDGLEVRPIQPPKVVGKQYEAHPNLPDVNKCFNLLICSPPGSGKSVIISNLVQNPAFGFADAFGDNVYVFSSTCAHGDPSMRFLHDRYRATVWSDYSDVTLQSIVNHQASYPKENRPKALVVFDDFLSFQEPKQSLMFQLSSSYRHWNLCLIFSSQLYKGVPPLVRQTCTDLLMHRNANAKERLKVAEEMSHRFGGPDAFDKLWTTATSESRHHFMYCQLYTQKARAFKNFTELMYESTDDGSPERSAKGFDGSVRRPKK